MSNDLIPTPIPNREGLPLVRERLVCKDGFAISVQASRYHYCSPRSDIGPYTHVECGFPTERCEELMPYADDPGDPVESVYPMVPFEVIAALVAKHGGLKETT